MQLIFATHNKNKIIEIKSLVNGHINLLSLNDIHFTDEINETAKSLEGNALLKAQTIYRETKINCFADDSGLLVDALNGEPGVYSARYAGKEKNDEANMVKILNHLKGIENRKAQFKTVLALIIDGKEHIFEGTIDGVITTKKKGINGFGYDPIFLPNGHEKTFAEMTLAEKSKISHRAIALKKMTDFINSI
ncbi:MAG: non-canonical purine NTP diphosphatase [Bacteroidota bacterium]|jgi:XTP/dITP diphosphohydrolase